MVRKTAPQKLTRIENTYSIHLSVRYCRLVRNLSTSKEGTIRAANLMSLIGKSKSCQSLTSSGSYGLWHLRFYTWHQYSCLRVSACLSQRAAALGT